MYDFGHKTYRTYYTQKFLVLRKSVKNAHTTRANINKVYKLLQMYSRDQDLRSFHCPGFEYFSG